MGQVAVNVNGRAYRFDCGEGEETRLKELAAYVKARFESLVREYGKVGDERLMLMAALLITDELLDAQAALAEAKAPPAEAAAASFASPPNGATATASPKATPGADKREQEAIRAEYRRKMASGEA
jgi:cell division protein ZapA